MARGGPDGGDGGRGGDVWLVARVDQSSLLAFRDHPFRRAADGGHGSGKRKHGAKGADLEVPVPVGTVVRDRDGSVLCDLSHAGDRWLAARGGAGGMGNARFLSNRRRAPAFAEQGERGEERWFRLELKLVADVALVGFPNVGKSTLISTISAAKPKIADYPFTTLEPHLGVVRVGKDEDEVDLVVADVPGLIEGAAEGRGLGDRFLRHVERARVLVVLVDLAGTVGQSAAEQVRVLTHELGRYRPELLERPRLIVGTKSDLLGRGPSGEARPLATAGDRVLDAPDYPSFDAVISAVTGEGVQGLLRQLAELVRASRLQEAFAAGSTEVVVHRPVPEGIHVERREQGTWEILGRPARRAVGFSDVTDPDAMEEALERLRRLGVDRLLARAGASDGDEVRVGDLSFTWYRSARNGSAPGDDAVVPAR